MITQLYTFAPGSYVVADEWNANFRTIYNVNLEHTESIQDATNVLAFKNGDLTNLYDTINRQPNSFEINGSVITVMPEYEYYKILGNGEDLIINVPMGLNAEVRILIQIQNLRTELPFIINYSGQKVVFYGDFKYFNPGYYYIIMYETNGLLQTKLIETGV